MTTRQLPLPLWRPEKPKVESRWLFPRFHKHSDESMFTYLNWSHRKWLWHTAKYLQKVSREDLLEMKRFKAEWWACIRELSHRYEYDARQGAAL